MPSPHTLTRCPQISQVCQLCQQSPRLFTNHAAQLHTLLVSRNSKVSVVESSGGASARKKPVRLFCAFDVEWLNGFVFTAFLRASTVSQSTAWITQRHSSPQPCGWVRSYLCYFLFFIFYFHCCYRWSLLLSHTRCLLFSSSLHTRSCGHTL